MQKCVIISFNAPGLEVPDLGALHLVSEAKV